MEKRIKRIEIFLVVTLFLVVLGIALQMKQISISARPAQITNNQADSVKSFTDYLGVDEVNKTVFSIREYYQKRDYEALYNLLGEYAQAQLSVEDVEDGFKNLRTATGEIITYAYSHQEYLAYSDEADWFNVYYNCRYEIGNGIIRLKYRCVGKSDIQLVGMNITLEEI